jgi:hypothetical protein
MNLNIALPLVSYKELKEIHTGMCIKCSCVVGIDNVAGFWVSDLAFILRRLINM